MTRAGFPHSDILGSRFVCQLPEAYRRLQRPSSAPSAKASTLCPYKLDHKDHSKKMLASTVQFSSYDRRQAPTPQRLPTTPDPFPGSVRWAVRLSGTSPQPPAPHPHPQARTACAATLNEQPSGCSLRTQQRAQPTPNPSSIRSHPTRRSAY